MRLIFLFVFNPFPYLPFTPPLNLKALFNATGSLYPPLSPFLYILRLWGRRKVHNPPPAFPFALKFLIYPFSPSHFVPLLFWQKGAFSFLWP